MSRVLIRAHHQSISPCQSNRVIQDTLKLFVREASQHDITLRVEQDLNYERVLSKTSILELDPGRLCQVVMNLITNAMKFTKQQMRREIVVRIGATTSLQPSSTEQAFETDANNGMNRNTAKCSKVGFRFLPVAHSETHQIGTGWNVNDVVYVHVMVEDSGSGISEADQSILFSRFSQGQHQDYSQYAGSGLGLYICRALVEIHGGQIGFRSELGKGSTFGFWIKTKRSASTTVDSTATIVPVKTPTKKPDIDRTSSTDSVISNDPPSDLPLALHPEKNSTF